MILKVPCKECKNRSKDCHSDCEEYKNWCEFWENLKEKIRKYEAVKYSKFDR
ncbi:MAG: hypothetical protein ACTTIO_04310 [Candidatus Fimenecus sp.]